MSIFKSTFVIVVILFSSLSAECDNSSLADYNEDNILDILDMVVLVEQIMTYSAVSYTHLTLPTICSV